MIDKRNIIGSGFLLLLAFLVMISSWGLGIGEVNNPQPGFFPFWTSLLLAILTLILLGIDLFKKDIPVHLTALWQDLDWRKDIIVAVSLFAYSATLSKIGYIIATLGLMMILFYLGKMKIWAVILSSLLAVLLSYGLFYYVFKTPLPSGILVF